MFFDMAMFLVASCEPGVPPFIMALTGGNLSEQILAETLKT